MSEWTTPKTDWFGSTNSEGVYTGDRFNAVDFNRIKNNLNYLRELSLQMYDSYSINNVGADKTPRDYFYADEINDLEENLSTINEHSLKRDYGTAPIYSDNGSVMDFRELNRLEGAILDLYDRLKNQSDGRRMFEWNFGMKGGIF